MGLIQSAIISSDNTNTTVESLTNGNSGLVPPQPSGCGFLVVSYATVSGVAIAVSTIQDQSSNNLNAVECAGGGIFNVGTEIGRHVFFLYGLSSSVSSIVVTMASACSRGVSLCFEEWSSLVPLSAALLNSGDTNTTATTAANNISVGALTFTQQPVLIWACSGDDSRSNHAPSVGTSPLAFTSGTVFPHPINATGSSDARTENASSTSLSSAGMTMTNTGTSGDHCPAFVMIVAQTSLPPGCAGGSDYSPPPRRYAAFQQDFQGMPLELLTAIIPKPLVAYDLSPPVRARVLPPSVLGIELNLLESTLHNQDRVLTPGVWNYRWPDALSRMPLALRAESKGLTANEITALSSPAPYYEYNWPVPAGPRQWQRTWEWGTPLELLGQDQIYGAPGQGLDNNMWDPPPGRRLPAALYDVTGPNMALLTTVQVKPVTPIDWPNPLPKRQPVFDWIQGSPISLLGTLLVYPPHTRQDWPVPPAPRRNVELLSWDYNGTLRIAQPLALPPGQQLDAPVWRRYWRDLGFELRPTIALPIIAPIFAGRVEWMVKEAGETVYRYMDFTDQLSPSQGEFVTSISAKASVWSGNDSNPGAIIAGMNLLNNTAGIAAVAQIIVTSGAIGTIYEVIVTAVTNLGNSISKAAAIAVTPAFN